MALSRLGHSVRIIDEHLYHPAPWRTTPLRLGRKLLRPLLVRELRLEAQRCAKAFLPDGVFVFKGAAVHPKLIQFYLNRGVPVVNFYPDVSFRVHGPYIPRALPFYSHVFTTKSWGIEDMKQQLGLKHVSFLEHGFDPEFDYPMTLTESERIHYGCEVVFVGTWSPKKEHVLDQLKRSLPQLRLKIWGIYWEKSRSRALTSCITGDEVFGLEYSKALQASSICLGLMSERRRGASSGDTISSRTFNIPASGAFMLHERNKESLRYFNEDEEAAFFASDDELLARVTFYLEHPKERSMVAIQGRERCLRSGYSLDERMKAVGAWFDEHLPTS